MPVSCSFRLNGKRMSILLCPGLGGVAAFSGDGESIDDPNATAKQDEGPLPAGTYFIVDRESGGRLGWLRDTIKDILVHSNRREWFALYRNDGVIDDETFINGIKRGAFRLHPAGRFHESKGCITLHNLSQFEKLRTFLKSQPVAFIPGTTIRYYGTVNVR
ncbi:DUF2778 domain-containing protein [Paraburkholderia bryophila]|uniref:DUF2778 domain-containing protein n=1 Tax=Paraburkholderia bryophila TaxID=420952 RepID=UPI00234B6FAF|nr:DUF2778 domain-containing protein [Paraburkholderia bryophila]WCM24584.1 DUF2778 domain-containing protein [Paraburkholderia bryophila]